MSTDHDMAKDNTPARENLLGARSLRYLHAIDLHGGVRAAADALAISGSVISRQVAQLERDHGVVLLERRGRRAVLTEIGLSLVEHYRESSRRDADMLAQLEDFRSLRRGRLGIGVGEGFIENLLATVLERFSLQFPDIVVELRSGTTSEIIAMVRNDDVDLGLCAGGGSDPAIRARTFRAAQFCALVSPHHPLAGERRSRFEQLRDQRLIFMPERFGAQQYLDAIIRAERLNLTPSYRCDLSPLRRPSLQQGQAWHSCRPMQRGNTSKRGAWLRWNWSTRSRANSAARRYGASAAAFRPRLNFCGGILWKRCSADGPLRRRSKASETASVR
jgi:LysR family transcriptional activator of glutamate synthase operon